MKNVILLVFLIILSSFNFSLKKVNPMQLNMNMPQKEMVSMNDCSDSASIDCSDMLATMDCVDCSSCTVNCTNISNIIVRSDLVMNFLQIEKEFYSFSSNLMILKQIEDLFRPPIS